MTPTCSVSQAAFYKVIYVKIYGGLGNQLYQYALGKALAVHHSTLCKLDLREFETYKLHRYSLSHFQIPEYLMEDSEFLQIDDPQRRKWYKRRGKIPMVREKSFHLDDEIRRGPAHAYFDGYWQSFRYFEEIRPILLQEISVKYAPSGENLEWLKQIRSGESVALHVRRGDYASNPTTQKFHGLCSAEYYQEACFRISARVKQPVFYIFSDDPSWVKQEFDYLENKKYVDNNTPLFNYEDLRLMSACHHQIIANSSFSWWAAWLNTNPNKQIFAPQKWFAGEAFSIEDRIHSDWTLL